MKHTIENWNLQRLVSTYEEGQLNLNPPYQRGDIWSLPSKKRLIESIKLRYPLPLFFIHQKSNGSYDMIDGQQRTRTIVGYVKGLFPDTNKYTIDETNKTFFLQEYQIAVCIITDVENGEIEDFYYRVNKFGTKLNRPEILKAQFGNSILQVLIENIASSPQLTSLNLFTDSSVNRLNDHDFIGEILALIKFGITDKKKAVDSLYEDKTLDESSAKELEESFFLILDDIIRFDEIKRISETRYRQKNDFYTLFGFLKDHHGLLKSSLDYFYRILISIEKDISPSQEKCYSLREYANNCVSQSNSKNARQERQKFFEELLLNKDNQFDKLKDEPISAIHDCLIFYEMDINDLVKIEEYYVLDVDKLK
ncbi:DUF262 domain-containing protein [Sphingobacterium zeae]|uniref:DUF262 domain-containing protein n=1 Tax=Sphingobacterium zeae TaxID=1776859 RepID=UPI0036078A6F